MIPLLIANALGLKIKPRPQLTVHSEWPDDKFVEFLNTCIGGDAYQMSRAEISEVEDLREYAEIRLLERSPHHSHKNPKKRARYMLWREEEDKLVCKTVFGSIRKQRGTKGFGQKEKPKKNDQNRIQTMWSEELRSWCRWDSWKRDYVVDESLNG
jgi:hypothetical protein